jgi:hypothetical protein
MNPNDTISNLNYHNDPRVRNAGANSIPKLSGCENCFEPEGCCDCTDEQYGSGEVQLPWHWVVCPTCNGKGSHVNPSIDCNGLTSEDFADDPEFLEDYFNGHFDQQCSHCQGRTTVPAVDYDAMSPELAKAYEEHLQFEADCHAEHMAEIRMGC